MAKQYVHTEVGGRKLRLSSLDRVLYPTLLVTKAELIKYYLEVADFICPFLSGRLTTLVRFPDGIFKEKFYSKQLPTGSPKWITKIAKGDDFNFSLESAAGLAWAVNIGSCEIHCTQVRLKDSLVDHLIFDLDPPLDSDFAIVKEVAKELRLFLERKGMISFLKTSGSKGLHLYVPISPQQVSKAYSLAKELAIQFVKTNTTTTVEIKKDKREGKVFIDYLRNNKEGTCVAPMSTRGIKGAPISCPLRWEDLDGIDSAQHFNIKNGPAYLKDHAPWKELCTIVDKLASNDSFEPDLIALLNRKYTHQLATEGLEPSDDLKYIYEVKWDGIRVMLYKAGNEVKLLSRNGNDITEQFPEIVEEASNLNAREVVLDGEIVVLDKKGRPVFADSISRLHTTGTSSISSLSKSKPAVMYCFDLLEKDRVLYLNRPQYKRTAALSFVLNEKVHLKQSHPFAEGKALFEAIKAKSMEGIMMKLKQAPYQVGQRTPSWVKVKVRTTIKVNIIGYTIGEGDRINTFGALHVSDFNNPTRYLGKVGTGFDQDLLEYLYSRIEEKRQINQPPYIDRPIDKPSIWIDSSLKAEVSYASLTKDGILREPVFVELIGD